MMSRQPGFGAETDSLGGQTSHRLTFPLQLDFVSGELMRRGHEVLLSNKFYVLHWKCLSEFSLQVQQVYSFVLRRGKTVIFS